MSESGDSWLSAENPEARLEDNTRTSIENGIQSADVKRTGVRAGRIAAGLMAALALMVAMLATPVRSSARIAIGVTVNFGPPALPYYVQPPCPEPGYIWTPGYWAWDPVYGYYWVPGTWIQPPFVGALWTPGYWDYDDGGYVWNAGYWGPAVGYYGGIDYGYGYTGVGYEGGYWNRHHFYYNRSVNNVTNVHVTNVYNRPVQEHFREQHISYHGGPGGTRGGPTQAQLAAARQRRSAAVGAQRREMLLARSNPVERARVNHGRPGIAATRRPGAFKGHGAVPAKRPSAPYHEHPRGQANPGGGRGHPAHSRRAAPRSEAGPHPHPGRPTREQPRKHEQSRRKSVQPGAHRGRQVPNRTKPSEKRYPENHAQHARPQMHYHQARAPKEGHHLQPKRAEHRAALAHIAHHHPQSKHTKHGASGGNDHGHGNGG